MRSEVTPAFRKAPRSPPWWKASRRGPRWLAVLGGVVALGAGAALVGSQRTPETSAGTSCPAATRTSAPREQAVLSLLRSRPEGAALLDGRRPVGLCFGQRDDSVIDGAGHLLLDERAGDAELAARSAHLLHHARSGLADSLDRAGGDCQARVESALADEAEALALELSLRRALGVTAPRSPLPFPDGAEAPAIVAFLRAHPDGAPGLPPLGRDYRTRCEAANTARGTGNPLAWRRP